MDERQATLAPPGSVLRDARQNRGWSEEDVAAQLNLLASQVIALENNDYSRFNAELFVKGFLRRYADLLDINAEPLLADCEHHFADERAQTAVKTLQPTPADRIAKLILALLVAIVVWSISVYLNRGGDSEVSETAASATVLYLPVNDIGRDLLRESTPDGVQETSAFGDAKPAVLTVRCRETVWIKIRDQRRDALMSSVMTAGEERELKGYEPFEVEVADWRAVVLAYNGQSIVLEGDEHEPAARLLVGEQ